MTKKQANNFHVPQWFQDRILEVRPPEPEPADIALNCQKAAENLYSMLDQERGSARDLDPDTAINMCAIVAAHAQWIAQRYRNKIEANTDCRDPGED